MGEEHIAHFTKAQFINYVFIRLGEAIPKSHIEGIFNIMLDEMFNDLKKGISISIANFGQLTLKQLAPRKHNHYKTGNKIVSPGKKSLRFYLFTELKRFLSARLDIDKTFGGI